MNGISIHQRHRNRAILAALLSVRIALPAWAAEPVAVTGSIATAQVSEQTPFLRLLPSSDAQTPTGEISEPVAATGAAPALVPTAESGASSPAPRPPYATPATSAASVATPLAQWRLAPIRIWGDIGYDFRRTSVEGQSAFTRHSAVANVNASTYIYEPWVAVVSAGLGVTLSRLNDGGASGGDKFVTGSARVNIFPMSRFPFEARYLRSDSGTDVDVGADQRYRLTRYGVTQHYRSEEGTQQYLASFDRFTQDGTNVGKDIQNALQFDASTRVKRDHELQLMASWNHNKRVITAERNDYETILARHAFRPDSTLSLENSVNFTHTASRYAAAESDLRIFQLSSIAFWRPESKPYTLNGSIRMFSLDNGTGNDSGGTRVLNASGGINYMINSNLRALGGISLSDNNSGGAHNRAGVATVGATYQGDSIEFSKYRYDWFASGTGIATSGASEFNGLSFNGVVGNALSRGFDLGNGAALSFNLSQNLSALTGAQVEGSKQLFHSGSVTWNKSEPESSASSFIRLSATDSRYLDGQHETLQLVNLQFTRTLDLGRDRALSGNLTVQTTRRVSKRPGFENSINVGNPETTVSADLNFRQQNLFGVPRLIFFSQLQINRQELTQSLGAPSERQLFSWENRLDYNIGRLETRMMLRLSELDGTQYWLVMLRATRRF